MFASAGKTIFHDAESILYIDVTKNINVAYYSEILVKSKMHTSTRQIGAAYPPCTVQLSFLCTH